MHLKSESFGWMQVDVVADESCAVCSISARSMRVRFPLPMSFIFLAMHWFLSC